MSVRRVLLTTDAVGGVWTYTVELARALSALGVEPVVATLGPSPDENQKRRLAGAHLFDTGLPLDWLAENPEEIRDAGAALAQLASDVRADVVQLHTAALACEVVFERSVVAVQHSCVRTWWQSVRQGALPSDLAWRSEMVACGLNAVDAVVAPTAAFARQTELAYELPLPVGSVHNGRTHKAVSARASEDVVLTVGRLWDHGKNVGVLDRAAASIDTPLEAVGPLRGPNGTAVQLDHLRTTGPLSSEEVTARLAARPIFASSALYEPFGLSVLEAAQAGCALVLSDIATFRELWDGAAILVDALDAHGFADAFDALLRDPARREELGRSARTRAQRYTPAATARGMLQVYERTSRSAPLPIASAA